jgi:glycosyltransferase involved in cell wall biosynthesis
MSDPAAIEMNQPRVSVVVPTRNRAPHVAPCIDSILANPGDAFELVVVDQSDDDSTERALADKKADRRFRLLRSPTRGASRSRNAGIAATRAPLVAFTDDDCRVAPDWIAQLERVFADHPDAAIVFGRVDLPENAFAGGFAADFQPHRREYQHCFPGATVQWGIGANMAVRRSVLARIGTFDPMLGPGSVFPAAEDTDLTIRAIAGGYKILNVREVWVLHLGVRQGPEASILARGYGVALGAAFAKHVRLGTQGSGRLLCEWLLLHGAGGLKNVVRGKKPSGLGFVAGMLRGVGRSALEKLDRPAQVYAAR